MCQPRAKLGLSARARSTSADHRADVLAEIGQREGGIRQDAGSSPATSRLASRNRCLLRRSAAGSSAPAIVMTKPKAADRRPGERRPVTRIARDRLLEQIGAPRGLARADDKTIA